MHLVKVLAAFVGGVGLALGTALVYLHVTGTQLRETVRDNPILDTATPALTSPVALPKTLPAAGKNAAPAVASADPVKPNQADDAAGQSATPDVQIAKPAPIVQPRKTVPVVIRRSHPPARAEPRKNRSVEIAQNEIPVTSNTPALPTPAPAPVQQAPAPVPEISSPAPPPAQATPAPSPAASAPQLAQTPPPAIATPPRHEPRTVTLAQGTLVVIRMGETVSTDENYSGDTFRATLDQPIIIGSAIIAERGSKVLGRVVSAQRAGRVQGVSDLTLTLVELNTTDGQRVLIHSTTLNQQGQTSHGTDVAKVGGGAALGAIIGAVAGGGKGAGIGAGVGGAAGAGDVLLTRGKPTIIRNEARLTFSLAQPVTITERLNY